jgi:predicted DNA binding CopG/RHH family protein
MKVFFTGSYRGKNEYGKFYETIYKEIERLGFVNLDREVIDMDYKEFVKQAVKDKQYSINHYQQKDAALHKADICIFDTSFHSLRVGFLVERALKYGKPAIVLYYKNNSPYFLTGIEDEKLIIRSYTEKNLKKILKEAIDLARQRSDKRFNFFISQKLLNYLESISKKEGINKSTFIRNLILEHMRGSGK